MDEINEQLEILLNKMEEEMVRIFFPHEYEMYYGPTKGAVKSESREK